MPKKLKSYRVWIHQVNQTYVDVKATDEWSAREKGYAKWRKEEAHSEVSYIEENEEENNK